MKLKELLKCIDKGETILLVDLDYKNSKSPSNKYANINGEFYCSQLDNIILDFSEMNVKHVSCVTDEYVDDNEIANEPYLEIEVYLWK